MLTFRASNLTDEEFVERIRRQTPTNRKLLAGMSVLFGAILVAMLFYVPRYMGSFREMVPDASAYEIGLKLGVFLGATFAGAFIFIAYHFVQLTILAVGPRVFRIHRLLLKYYDAAKCSENHTNQ